MKRLRLSFSPLFDLWPFENDFWKIGSISTSERSISSGGSSEKYPSKIQPGDALRK